jgi:UDP-3-O-[3-hydroxymyristoyl] glucosamine N-acyltransferase
MREAALARGACIVADDPYLYFARVTQLWKARMRAPGKRPGDPPQRVVDPAPCSARGRAHRPALRGRARRAHRRRHRAEVARHVGEGCVIGARCVLHPGVVIGADGFGFAPNQGAWEKIEQLGAVRIGDDVEIGANTCIDRGALADTVIEDGVKLDNLIQVGHNVPHRPHTAIAGCAGIAGSATIGAHCTIGGSAGILGHLTIADHVHISAFTLVTRSIHKPGHYTGIFPIDDNATWEKNAASLKQLHALRDRVKALEKKIP